MEESHCYYTEYKPTFWERVQKFLGYGDCLQPDFEGDPRAIEGYTESHLVSVTLVHLDWKDRLRLLISGRLVVRFSTKTDKIIEKAYSKSNVSVAPVGYRPV
jgi:hypothetical protein